MLVDGASTLDQVHEVIQAAFGWWNYHLHECRIDGVDYGVPDPDEDWGPPVTDESTVRLDSVAKAGSKFEYVYDFGDNWRHKVVVEKVTQPRRDHGRPRLHRRPSGLPARGLRRHLGLPGTGRDPGEPSTPRASGEARVDRPPVRP